MYCLYVSWLPDTLRGENIMQALGFESLSVEDFPSGQPSPVPSRTAHQKADIRRALDEHQPRLVIVACPPLAAPQAVAAWCRRNDAAFVIDAHPATFPAPKGLRRLADRAALTLVTAPEHAEELRGWNAPVAVVDRIPSQQPLPAAAEGVKPGSGPDDVLLINTYKNDEPLKMFFEAAAFLPEVKFGVTGKLKDAPRKLRKQAPPNVTLTGWLSENAYWERLAGARALMTLASREANIRQGGWEAIELGQPLITSDWPTLRRRYPQGAVHVENTAQGIAIGVEWVLMDEKRLREEMQALREEQASEWEQQSAPLRALVEQAWQE